MRNSLVQIGDKVKVVLDGAVRELEIIDLPDANSTNTKVSLLSTVATALFGKRYPFRVVVKAPNGQSIECHLMRPAV